MCAEGVWWRCHRNLIADYPKADGIEAVHICDARTTLLHPVMGAASRGQS
jgi:uncharacterized protein (DUF488 family)